MPDGEQDGQREEETAERAAGADEAGSEDKRESGQEESEENVAREEASESDPGEDPVEEEAEEPAGENAEEETEAAEKKAEDGEKAAEEPAKKKEKRGMFRSGKELQKKEQEIAELKDQLLRARAEFENFRKRTDKEKAVRFDDGAMFILQKLLPVVDNFERGLAQVPGEAKDDPYVSGLEKIYKQLTAVLQESSVTPIEAVGKEFDPELHNAVMHVDDEELGENVVAEEFQKGYSYKDRVLRHSMVKVAN
ncbi:MAG: nucleotide exchange factor GrpE [Lachnospiraceae bacterium]|nr:nucleotide exchange factor GrpE [Lachnospiraceae bacterium]